MHRKQVEPMCWNESVFIIKVTSFSRNLWQIENKKKRSPCFRINEDLMDPPSKSVSCFIYLEKSTPYISLGKKKKKKKRGGGSGWEEGKKPTSEWFCPARSWIITLWIFMWITTMCFTNCRKYFSIKKITDFKYSQPVNRRSFHST